MDEGVLEAAWKADRVVLTYDRKDFGEASDHVGGRIADETMAPRAVRRTAERIERAYPDFDDVFEFRSDRTRLPQRLAYMSDDVRVWLVERTFSDDEQNLIVLTYATPDGRHEFRKERALPSFTGDQRETPASLEVDPNNLASVDDPQTRERYKDEAARVADEHGRGGTI